MPCGIDGGFFARHYVSGHPGAVVWPLSMLLYENALRKGPTY